MLLNYHIGRFGLGSMCVGDWCGQVGVVSVLRAEACNTDMVRTGALIAIKGILRFQNIQC